MMTENDNEPLGKRMERIEKDIAEIKVALLGNVMDGTTGLLGRVRDRERTAEHHDLRILSLENEAKRFIDRRQFEDLEKKVDANTAWRERLTWMVAGAATVGGITGGGIVAALIRALGG